MEKRRLRRIDSIRSTRLIVLVMKGGSRLFPPSFESVQLSASICMLSSGPDQR